MKFAIYTFYNETFKRESVNIVNLETKTSYIVNKNLKTRYDFIFHGLSNREVVTGIIEHSRYYQFVEAPSMKEVLNIIPRELFL